MATLIQVHLQAQARLRQIVYAAIASIWQGLGTYDEEDVDRFVVAAVPIVLAGQTQAVALTEAFILRRLGLAPLGLDPAELTGAAVRGGVSPEEVYRRPFVNVWTALGKEVPWEQAVNAGEARATASAEMDIQLSSRATYGAAQRVEPRIRGYRRRANGGACKFCLLVNGAFVKNANAMPLHNRCLIGRTLVSAPAGLRSEPSDFGSAEAVTRRWYVGEVVVLKTALGNELSITPNHPILTPHGWVAAGALHEGNNVVSSSRLDREHRSVPYEDHVPTSIEQYFRAGAMTSLASVPFAAKQFHGDIGNGDVSVVAANGSLDVRTLAALGQPSLHPALPKRLLATLLPCECGLRQRRFGVRAPALGLVSSRRSSHAFSSGLVGGTDDALLGYGPALDISPVQSQRDRITTDAIAARDAQDTLAGQVALDHIVSVDWVTQWTGHVYNLVTRHGWYVADGIVTHNCGCGLDPIMQEVAVTAPPEGVAVHQHGELGPMLGDSEHEFTSASNI